MVMIILIFLDVTNFFTKLIDFNCGKLCILFLIGLFVVFSIISINFLKMLKLKSVNFWDFILIVSFLSCCGLIIYTGYCTDEVYKDILLFNSTLLVFVLFIIRIYFYTDKSVIENSNVLDLKDLYRQKYYISKEKFVLLEETAVDYDLLHREEIISVLYDTILNCHPKRTFTVGLNGKWGSGKTTIINNVIARIEKNEIKDSFVIVKFDPWDYDNEKSLLKGLVDEIFYSMGIDYDVESINSMVESLIDVIFYTSDTPFYKILKNNSSSTRDKLKVEKKINDYLVKHDKRLLLVIDNLDRIDSDKINFIIRCIESILEFKSTICVLLYDEILLENSLRRKFGWEDEEIHYMEKVIQLKFDVPIMDEDSLDEILGKISNNVILDNNTKLSTLLSGEKQFKDVRDFKRFLNNIFVSFNGMSEKINTNDLLKLEYIRINNPSLYYSIWDYKTYFISDDRQYDIKLYEPDYKGYNEAAKNFFTHFFENINNEKYKDILKELFPNVVNFFEKKDVINSSGRGKEEYQKGIRERRIYNTRYFDLYFTKSSNIFVKINKDIDDLIKVVNTTKQLKINKKIDYIISKYDSDALKVVMEVLEINFEKINKKAYLSFALELLNYINNIYYKPIFLGIDARTRCEVIISKLLNLLDVEEMKTFCEKISFNFSNIYSLHVILHYMENESEKNIANYNLLKGKYDDICKKIIEERINLYSNKYYAYANIWGLYHYDKKEVIKYVKSTVDGTNIFKFLNDLVSHSVGTNGYGYYIKQDTVDALGPNIGIQKLIDLYDDELTDDQKFLLNIYNLYIHHSDKKYHDDEIYEKEYRNISNI